MWRCVVCGGVWHLCMLRDQFRYYHYEWVSLMRWMWSMYYIVCFNRNTVVAESNVVYKLEPKSYDSQVQDLVKSNNFELALQIAVSIN